MELRQLEVFVAVAEEGSFTRAAARLHVVQSAVSTSVRVLERELGTALFERSTRAVTLTGAGEVLVIEAHAVLAAVAAARDAVEQTKGGLRGSVAMGIMQAQALPGFTVPHLIGAFQREHPFVDISVGHVGGSAVLAESLRVGTVDLAILSLPAPAPGLDVTELAVEPMVLAVAADHRLAGSGRISLSRLAGETFVDGPPSWGTRLASDRAFAERGIERRIRYEINETGTVVDFVRAGTAVALLPWSLAVGQSGIATVEIEGDPIPFRTLLAVATGRRPSAAARSLAEAIVAAVRERPVEISR